MTFIMPGCIVEQHEKKNACYNCCETCNYDEHRCPGCGSDLTHDGRNSSGPHKGLFHIDCLEEWEVKDGKFVRLTEFGERMRSR